MADNLNFSRDMKSKHIKKETAKRLREGFHTDLMELIEDGIDLYGEKNFERGYQSFFGDASVHALRIAKNIEERGVVVVLGSKYDVFMTTESLAKIIEKYFNSLKTE